MKIPALLSVAALAAACVPYEGFYKSGATVTRLNTDLTNCEVLAAQRVPTNTQVGVTPTYTTPITTSCYGYGYSATCSTTGGQVYGGNVYSYDANAGLRKRVKAQCMGNKGYEFVSIPLCGEKAKKENSSLRQKVLPKLTGNTCYMRNGLDEGVFVTPKS